MLKNYHSVTGKNFIELGKLNILLLKCLCYNKRMRFSMNSRRLRGAISIIIGIFVLSLVPLRSQASADFTTDVNVIYRVDEQSQTNVEQVYTITNNVSTKYLGSLQLSTSTDDVRNLKAVYSDGTVIPTSTEKKEASNQGYTYQYQEITIKFNKQNVGRGLQWQFKLSYDTSRLVETKGPARTVLIPAIAPSSQDDNYDVVLSVPSSFGTPRSTGATPTSGGLDGGRSLYKFAKADLTKQAVSVVFGDKTVYKLNFNFPLKNDTNLPRTYSVTLPPDSASQKIYVNSLDPKPVSTRLDADGNVLADYAVPAKSEITVKTDIVGVVKYLEYDMSASGEKSDIPDALVKKYTSATQFWQSTDPNIVSRAKQAVEGKNKVADIVKTLDKFVVDTLSYNNEKIKYNIRQGALKALENPTNAVCLEYSDLMVALLRSQGIPARMPIGYAYSGDLKASPAVSDSLHSWVEVYVPNVGWMNIDPTWGEKFDNFGKSDLDHFAFSIWGGEDSKPSAVSVNGADQGYQYEKSTLEYLKESPEPSNNGSVTAEKWVIFPFVSMVHYVVVAPSNVSGDNYRLKVVSGNSNQTADLGSLAAGQKVSSWLSDIGTNFAGKLNVEFGQTGETSIILSTIKVDPNYLPMIVVLSIIAGIIIIVLIRLRIKRRRAQRANMMRDPSAAPTVDHPRDTAEILKEISARTAQRRDDNDKQ